MSYDRKRAFAAAERLAAKNWLDASALGNYETTNDAIGEVEDALDAAASIDVEQWLTTNVPDRPTHTKISDAIGEQRVASQEAGFLYGLALGLTLGRGGPR